MLRLAALLSCLSSTWGAVELPSLFSDHLVVQEGRPLPVWGTASAGAELVIACAGQERRTTTAADGRWRVVLDPLPAGTPLTLTVAGDGSRLEIADVLVGEVWYCSGQSNMVLTLGDIRDQAAVDAADLPTIRCYALPARTATAPEAMPPASARWTVCSPATAARFSAAAFHFARSLQAARKVPVGLVIAAVGGTPIRSWLPRSRLAEDAAMAATLARQDAAIATFPADWRTWTGQVDAWRTAVDAGDPGIAGHWEASDLADGDWPAMTVPGAWDDADPALAGQHGTVWFRHRFPLPAGWAGTQQCLFLGAPSDYCDVWINGQRAAADDHHQRGVSGSWRRYLIPPERCRFGAENVIAVRVSKLPRPGKGGLTAAWQPMQIAPSGDGPPPAVPVVIQQFRGTSWRYRTGLRANGRTDLPAVPAEPAIPDAPGSPQALHNGMVHAIASFPVRGGIWYQGESDAHARLAYAPWLTRLIASWREAQGDPRLPVLVVQLPGIGKPSTTADTTAWSMLRLAQERACRAAGAGLAVTIDTCADGDLHPREKRPVGERLALLARRLAYGEAVAADGPRFREAAFADGRARIAFAAEALPVAEGPVAGFWLAGADRRFHPATARVADGVVEASCPEVPQPVAARYAWGDHPACGLRSADGLPAAPFRTDDWD